MTKDDKSSLKGTWSGHVTHFKFGGPMIPLERLKIKSSLLLFEIFTTPTPRETARTY